MKPISKKELARMYGVSAGTLKRWIRSVPFEPGQNPADSKKSILNIAQLRAIFAHLGEP